MSGYSDEAVIQPGLLEPGSAFLQKPFSAHELTAKIRGLLDGVDAMPTPSNGTGFSLSPRP